jgi:hypothetical protein
MGSQVPPAMWGGVGLGDLLDDLVAVHRLLGEHGGSSKRSWSR